MDPFPETSTLPLSIAQLDPTVYADPAAGSVAADPAGLPVLVASPPRQERILAAVVVRAGEVEAAEWALDQARAACGAQIAAALCWGVPAKEIALAAGVGAAGLAELIAGAAVLPEAG
jgi:hypothetical protein